MSAADYHPRTDVSYAATKPFIKAFPKEAFMMHKKFNTPTWSLRIIEEDQEVLRQVQEQMSLPEPEPPTFVTTTTTESAPVVLPAPAFAIAVPWNPTHAKLPLTAPSAEYANDVNSDMIALGVGVAVFAIAGFLLYRCIWGGSAAVEIIAP